VYDKKSGLLLFMGGLIIEKKGNRYKSVNWIRVFDVEILKWVDDSLLKCHVLPIDVYAFGACILGDHIHIIGGCSYTWSHSRLHSKIPLSSVLPSPSRLSFSRWLHEVKKENMEMKLNWNVFEERGCDDMDVLMKLKTVQYWRLVLGMDNIDHCVKLMAHLKEWMEKQEKNEKKKEQKWNCVRCTFINSGNDDHCSKCGYNREEGKEQGHTRDLGK